MLRDQAAEQDALEDFLEEERLQILRDQAAGGDAAQQAGEEDRLEGLRGQTADEDAAQEAAEEDRLRVLRQAQRDELEQEEADQAHDNAYREEQRRRAIQAEMPEPPSGMYYSPYAREESPMPFTCEEAVIRGIRSARTSIRILAYMFTNVRILGALVAAKGRNVALDVQIILDADYQGMLPIHFRQQLEAVGVQIRVRRGLVAGKYSAMHEKTWIIDGRTVMVGSFNPTQPAANNNCENLAVINAWDFPPLLFIAPAIARFESLWSAQDTYRMN